jgi:hypothetical protein
VSPNTEWGELEELLANVLAQHFMEASVGLRSKKLKTDHDSPDGSALFSLGLTFDSIKFYSIGTELDSFVALTVNVCSLILGTHHWSPGTPAEKLPHYVLNVCQVRNINVRLFSEFYPIDLFQF